MGIDWFFYYIIYAFLGYICEVIYVSTLKRKLTNRGYLYGPICPIYGYGAILVIGSLQWFYNNGMWYLVLISGCLLTTTLEYLTSVVMEYLFHMRWWDYSERKFNIKGRVCLRNSLMFTALVMIVMYLIHPLILNLLALINKDVKIVLFVILLSSTIIDTVFSTLRHIKATKIVDKIRLAISDKGSLPTKEQIIEGINNTKFVKFIKKYTTNYEMVVKNSDKTRIKLKDYIQTLRYKHNDEIKEEISTKDIEEK